MTTGVTIDFNANLARYTSQVDKAISDLSKFQSHSDRINANLVKVFKTSFTEINSAFSLLGSAVDKFKDMASGVVSFVTATTHAQDEMGKMAQKAGMGVESFSALSYAVKLAGGDQETLVKATKALSGNIIEAARAADQGQTVFGGLGITVKDSAGKLRATDQILLDVAGKFSGMEDGANKSALAVKLFGKSGLDLVPFLNQGKEGIQALTKEAERLGIVVSGEAFAASEKFNDNIERMSQASEGLKRSIGNAALPMLNEFVQQLTDAKMSGDGLAGTLKGLFTQANIEDWAHSGARAVAFLYDAAKGVSVVFQDIAGALGAGAAAAVQVLQGNFDAAAAINEQWRADSLRLYDYEQMRDKVDTWFDEYRRTVRVNGERIVLDNADQAKAVQKIYDEHYAALGAKSTKFVEFDEATLKKQEALRKKYGDEEKRRQLGDVEFARQQIREKYEAEINALRGAGDEAVLVAEIRKRMDAEVAAVSAATLGQRASGEAQLIDVVRSGAAARVQVETAAAQQVVALWNQANAVKAAQTGGQIVNVGTPGEFVSSWDANGNYVGDLGKTVSSPGALGNAYGMSGRKLTVQEEIAMLNGYARFATGGSFLVGGSGGTDSQLVAFKASPDERVTIETPAQQRASGAGAVTINVHGGSPSAIIAAIKQALRTDPGLFSTAMARAG